jgi:hypothetical protein
MTSGKSVILVVEDEVPVRMMAVSVAEDRGFEVLSAASADEAIGILESRSDIRLVFTDVHMPGSMDGLRPFVVDGRLSSCSSHPPSATSPRRICPPAGGFSPSLMTLPPYRRLSTKWRGAAKQDFHSKGARKKRPPGQLKLDRTWP